MGIMSGKVAVTKINAEAPDPVKVRTGLRLHAFRPLLEGSEQTESLGVGVIHPELAMDGAKLSLVKEVSP